MATIKITSRHVLGARLLLGRSQQTFAELLGVGYPTISRWENGHTSPQGLFEESVDSKLRRKIGSDWKEKALYTLKKERKK